MILCSKDKESFNKSLSRLRMILEDNTKNKKGMKRSQ